MARDIFVISDLHMGDRGPRDNFEAGDRTRQLHAFLDFVAQQGGELFVLGDLFELWQVNFSRLMLARRDILDHLAELDVVYVPGNHDVDLAGFVGTGFLSHPFFSRMRPPFTRELGGKRFRFFHGHEVDPMNRGEDPGWGRMMSIFAGIFESENRSPFLPSGEAIEASLSRFGDSLLALWSYAASTIEEEIARKERRTLEPSQELTPAQQPDRASAYAQLVRADRAREGYDIAVLGHTHKPGHIDGWYFNSGTWTAPFNPYLRISEAGEVSYFHWEDGREVPRPMPVAHEAPGPKKLLVPAGQKAVVDNVIDGLEHLWRQRKKERARWVQVLQGLLAVAVGVVAFASLEQGLGLLLLLFAAYVSFDGVLALLAARASRWRILKKLQVVRGVVSLSLGAVALLRPAFTEELLVFLVGAWFLAVGALRLLAASLFPRLAGGRWSVVSGAAEALAGLLVMAAPSRLIGVVAVAACALLVLHGGDQALRSLFSRRGP